MHNFIIIKLKFYILINIFIYKKKKYILVIKKIKNILSKLVFDIL